LKEKENNQNRKDFELQLCYKEIYLFEKQEKLPHSSGGSLLFLTLVEVGVAEKIK